MIKIDELIDLATEFHLGWYLIEGRNYTMPVVLKKIPLGWAVQADVSSDISTLFCLNSDGSWKYKHGTAWETKETALRVFNSYEGKTYTRP